MIGKNLIGNRGVMIAAAVIALMTLTAGVAAAASMKAHKIEADGGVAGVALALGGTVDSKFKIKDGVIKSVKITTVDEGFFGGIDVVTNCEEKGKHGEGACDAVDDILIGATVESSHTSKAKLKVIFHDAVSIVGTLKGELKADLKITGANSEILEGTAKLKIRSTDDPSVYSCLLGFNPTVAPAGVPIFGPIELCIASSGPNAFGLYFDDLVGTGTGFYIDPAAGPVLVPVVLHVVDKGKFKVKSDVTEMNGKIKVSVDSVAGITSGTIQISKAKAEFGDDEEEDD